MFDINIQNIPKKVWVMFGVSFMLISIGITFSLIFRGSAIFKADKPIDKTLADNVKEFKEGKELGPVGPPKGTTGPMTLEFGPDGRLKWEQWGFGRGTKEVKHTTNGVVIKKGD